MILNMPALGRARTICRMLSKIFNIHSIARIGRCTCQSIPLCFTSYVPENVTLRYDIAYQAVISRARLNNAVMAMP